jgi:hypothetical protein
MNTSLISAAKQKKILIHCVASVFPYELCLPLILSKMITEQTTKIMFKSPAQNESLK